MSAHRNIIRESIARNRAFVLGMPSRFTLKVFLSSISCLVLAACVGANDPVKSVSPKTSPSEERLASLNDVGGGADTASGKQQLAHINNKTKFSSRSYGVESSPRITTVKRPRKGGGRYQIGKPYKIKGRWYKPELNPRLRETGLASWYGPNFHGRLTANGEIYDQYALSAAHPTMPLPSYAYVTNLENGRKIKVRVNDRGPFARGRVIDLSARAAKLLGYTKKGLAKVKVEYAGKAQMDGLDEDMLMATYIGPKGSDIGAPPANQSGSGTMLAINDQQPPTSSETAITSTFAASEQTISGIVALPTPRPTLFEGTPLAGTKDVIITATPDQKRLSPANPLSFAQDLSDVEIRIAELQAISLAYHGQLPENLQTIALGRLDASALSLVSALLEDLPPKISQSDALAEASLVISEKNANSALERLKQAGLLSVEIR